MISVKLTGTESDVVYLFGLWLVAGSVPFSSVCLE